MSSLLKRFGTRRQTAVFGGIAVLLVIAALVLPLLGLLFWRNASSSHQQIERAERALESALLGAVNAESGLRGYVITGDRAFFAPHDEGLRAFAQSVGEAHAEVRDFPEITAELAAVSSAMQVWITTAAQPQIALVDSGQLDEAQALAAEGVGKRAFDTFRATTNAALISITAERNSQGSALDRATALMLLLGGVGLLCAFGVVGGGALAALAHRREVERHEATELQLQEARTVSKQRGDILAAASHDLRNPLGAIVLAADVLQQSASDAGDEGLSFLADQVAAAAQRTAMLVSDLLDFTRVEAGRLVIERRRLDPVDVVNEAIADMRLWRPSQVVEVEANLDRRANLEGDPKRLRAAVRNLLENACQYAQAPYRIRVLDNDEVVEIHVEDAGPGIPQGEREGIFDQFHRGTTSAGREGTGIGLYMCRGIVELHGGKLDIADSPLGGSDFICRMPAAAMA